MKGKMIRLTCVMLGCLLLIPAAAMGSGFAVAENGTKAVAMGGAFVAQADDPSAVYFNPAGIVQLDGFQFATGISYIAPAATFESAGTSALRVPSGTAADQETDGIFVPYAYATYKYNDKMSFGVGSFSNYGLASEWPENYELRYVTGGTFAEIVTISINPVVAYKVSDKISLAVGPVMQYGEVTLENKLPTFAINPAFAGAPDGHLKLEGDDFSWGFNLAALFWLTDNVKLGLSYRSEVEHELSGDTNVSALPLPFLNQTVGVDADLTLPAVTYAGIAWINGPLTLEFDIQYTEWSSFEKLDAAFNQPVLALGGVTSVNRAFNWDDAVALRFGLEYRLSEMVALRCGLIYDESPIPDETLSPLIPSGDRWLYTIGLGYKSGKMTLDFAYNYLDDEGRNFQNPNAEVDPFGATGDFNDVSAHILMVGFSYAF